MSPAASTIGVRNFFVQLLKIKNLLFIIWNIIRDKEYYAFVLNIGK